MVSIFVKRAGALLADFFVVSAFMWIVSFFLSIVINPYEMFVIYDYFPYVVPVLIMVYFVVLEKNKGSTVGKALMYLEVRSLNGFKISYTQSFFRNLSKIYWLPIIFDWAFGKIFRKDDRLLSYYSKTQVIEV